MYAWDGFAIGHRLFAGDGRSYSLVAISSVGWVVLDHPVGGGLAQAFGILVNG
jgi:hypothetical protein